MGVTLREIQQKLNRERKSSDLQHLEADFYTQVGELLDKLYEERNEHIKTTNNPFQSREIQELSDKIQTIEDTVDALYQQRSGKIIDKAGFAAADMIDGINGATKEEEQLFENLVTTLTDARKNIATTIDEQRNVSVDMSLTNEQETPDTTTEHNTQKQVQSNTNTDNAGKQKTRSVENGEPAINIDSDNLLSEDNNNEENNTSSEQATTPSTNNNEKDNETEPNVANRRNADNDIDVIPDETQDNTEIETTESNTANIDRITVEIETSIGKIIGTDNREYTLEENDVVTLPKENASALISKDAAKKIDT